jgi:cobalt-zinc-cadmium efflux system outer membrane protein
LTANQASPRAWTLDEAIAATLTSDPQLHIGRAEINMAKAELLTSSLIPNPTVNLAGEAIPYRGYAEVDGGPPAFVADVEIPLDWFLFAKRKAEMNSARWEVRQTQAECADLIRQRVTETAIAFYDVLEAKALLTVARQDMENLTVVESAIQRAVEAGGTPRLELDRIRLELYRSRQELLKAESELAIAKAQLWAQFGRTDRDPTFDIRGDLDAPLTAKPYLLAEAFLLAEQNRPDIKALRIQVNKAKADTVVEKRNAYPEVSMNMGHLKEFGDAGVYRGWGVGVTATIPLFDRNQGNRMKSLAEVTKSSHELRSGIIELRAEVEEADQLFRTAYQKASALADEEVRLAGKVRDSVIEAYKVGGQALIDVLDAERSYREIYSLYISSRADYWRAMYLYNSVIGSGSYK